MTQSCCICFYEIKHSEELPQFGSCDHGSQVHFACVEKWLLTVNKVEEGDNSGYAAEEEKPK